MQNLSLKVSFHLGHLYNTAGILVGADKIFHAKWLVILTCAAGWSGKIAPFHTSLYKDWSLSDISLPLVQYIRCYVMQINLIWHTMVIDEVLMVKSWLVNYSIWSHYCLYF